MPSTWTAAEIARVRRVIASGAKSVTHDGQTITYQEFDKLIALLNRMESDAASPKRKRVGFISPGSGL